MNTFYHGGNYGPAKLKRWARAMKYFRICGSHGGHFDDGDSLRVLLSIPTIAETVELFRGLGATVELAAEASTNSGRISIGGTQLYFCSDETRQTGFMMFEGSTDWDINDAMVKAAVGFEQQWLDQIAGCLVDPPYDAPNRCISPHTHPEVWE